MRHLSLYLSSAITLLTTPFLTTAIPSPPHLLEFSSLPNANLSVSLFAELEELSRIVDISYCVGTTGISKPFLCSSRCEEFPDFELVDTFNTGPLMSDSCGYIVLDHGTSRVGQGRVIVAFRGTYSIANTIVDLSTVPQEYVPYPADPGNGIVSDAPTLESPQRHLEQKGGFWGRLRGRWFGGTDCQSGCEQQILKEKEEIKCENCTVHSGFWTSWQNTRDFILPHIKEVREKYPDYKVNLVGHSLGGAVAALAGLEFDSLGWEPTVTTFGEPKVGNAGLRTFIDRRFGLLYGNSSMEKKRLHSGRYRRITHVDDPVPLLPLHEWGYKPHAGEVFISKGPLQPSVSDLRLCYGDEDPSCIAGAEMDGSWFNGIFADAMSHESPPSEPEIVMSDSQEEEMQTLQRRWGIPIPSRYKMWQLFFAHRDYFWRLGLCVRGGDPSDWGRDKYRFGDREGNGDDVRFELRRN